MNATLLLRNGLAVKNDPDGESQSRLSLMDRLKPFTARPSSLDRVEALAIIEST